MIISLTLTPEEADLLTRRAESDAASIDAVLHGLIATLAPPVPSHAPQAPSPAPNADALLNSLRGDDAIDDPEDRADWEREQAEMRANVARWRAEQGLEEGR